MDYVEGMIKRLEASRPDLKNRRQSPYFTMWDRSTKTDDLEQTIVAPVAGYRAQIIQHIDVAGTGTLTNQVPSCSAGKATTTIASAKNDYETHSITSSEKSCWDEASDEILAQAATGATLRTTTETTTPATTETMTNNSIYPADMVQSLIALIDYRRKNDLFDPCNRMLAHELVYRGTGAKATEIGDLKLRKNLQPAWIVRSTPTNLF